MIGYHYTTREAYESIKVNGLIPEPISPREYKNYKECLPNLPKKAVWVWTKALNDLHSWVVVTSLAAVKASLNVVLLKVNYQARDAASIIYNEKLDEHTYLKCSFTAGALSTGSQLIELLVHPISPENIELIWESDLLWPVQGRHTDGEMLECTK